MPKIDKNTKTIKNRKLFENIFTIVLIVVCVLTMLTSGIVIFQKTYFKKFYVNGQSMYPYLNKDAEFENHEKYGVGGGMVSGNVAYKIDYGIMDAHENTINKLKRFDIVVWNRAKEPDKEYLLIKRLIGLPGETIRFSNYDKTLEVKDKDGNYRFVEQPIDNNYIAPRDSESHSIEVTLGSNEYYLMGDNRANSDDSRKYGTAKKSEIAGKAVAIIGKCELHKSSNGAYNVENVKYQFWPRFF